MTLPYEPSASIKAKIARRLVPYRARRDLHFRLNRPVVSFTFDDFPRSAIENGSNVLETEGWQGTFYVAAGLAGLENHHGQSFEAEDLPKLIQRGHEIAGHTFTHTDCELLSADKVRAEIDRNHTALLAMGVQQNLDHFAYPFGAASAQLKQSLQGRFKTMRGIHAGVHHNKADLNGLMSAPLFSGQTLKETLHLIEGLKTRPGWLTLFAHDIRENPSDWGCTPNDFKTVIAAVKESGALVLPIGRALEYLESKHG